MNKDSYTKEEIKEIIMKLMKDNDTNNNSEFYDGYNDGVHDGYLDVLTQLGIETEEEYRN